MRTTFLYSRAKNVSLSLCVCLCVQERERRNKRKKLSFFSSRANMDSWIFCRISQIKDKHRSSTPPVVPENDDERSLHRHHKKNSLARKVQLQKDVDEAAEIFLVAEVPSGHRPQRNAEWWELRAAVLRILDDHDFDDVDSKSLLPELFRDISEKFLRYDRLSCETATALMKSDGDASMKAMKLRGTGSERDLKVIAEAQKNKNDAVVAFFEYESPGARAYMKNRLAPRLLSQEGYESFRLVQEKMPLDCAAELLSTLCRAEKKRTAPQSLLSIQDKRLAALKSRMQTQRSSVRCSRCGGATVVVFRQTRAADEASTAFDQCVLCKATSKRRDC